LRSSLSDRKVGLALSSGAARGLAHIGVLEVLEREGIPIDMIAGTSMGAIIGATYAQGKNAIQIKEVALDLGWKKLAQMLALTPPKTGFPSGRKIKVLLKEIIGAMYAQGKNAIQIKEVALNLRWKKLAQLLALTPPKTGFLSGRKIKPLLKEIIGEVDFADLRMPFACVATDIITGEEVVIKQGPVLEAVIASMSLPVIFKAARWQGRYLVDGGVVNPVPVSVLKDMGADFIIAVNVISKPSDRAGNDHLEERGQKEMREIKEPGIFSMMMRLVNVASYQVVKSGLIGADVVIEPKVASIGFADFHRARECIFQGELAAQDSVQEIKRRLVG
jgi:NTE family protein